MRAMAPPTSSARPGATLVRLGWALAACFILVTGILLTQTNRLRNELAGARDRVAALSRDLEAERHWSAILSSPAMRTATFTLTPDADPSLRGRAVMDPRTRRAVLVFGNFEAPSGKVYELWALHGTTPATLGPIRPDPSGHAVVRVEDVGDPSDLSAFAVSLETDGGTGAPGAAQPPGAGQAPDAAREPAGPVVMIGSLGS